MCVLIANMVLLRGTHNFTGWGEAFVALQLVSFIVILYMDSVILTSGPIAYFFDEWFASWTAWLGVLLVACSLYIENAAVDSYKIYQDSVNGPNRVGIEFKQTKKGDSKSNFGLNQIAA